jgi:cytoplasmic FMR1 interacting protein
MIKGLQVLMARMETVFSDAIRRHLYAETQDFVQLVLRDPLRKAIKNKKDMVRVIIMSVRETCADWMRGTEPADDPALKGKKDPEAGYDLKVPRRNVGELQEVQPEVSVFGVILVVLFDDYKRLY